MNRTALRRVLAVALSFGFASAAIAQPDFGARVEAILTARSDSLFGVQAPLAEPANDGTVVPRQDAEAADRVLLAGGLEAEFVARNLAQLGDMFAFWPDATNPTHLIVCIEQGRSGETPLGNDGLNPSVQRVALADGEVETILHGMDRCDGIRRTAWATVLATEETDDGRAYEIIDPLGTTGHWIADRALGNIRDAIDGIGRSQNVVQRPQLPTMAWEGLTILESGVLIGGDELRPGTDVLDSDGGAIFKFVPDVPHLGGDITDLADSPLVSGSTYAMLISCVDEESSSFPQYGQGCEIGVGVWVRVNALSARTDADANGATGYYRPEDLHSDPLWEGGGVRFCWTNTGNEGARNYGEVLCAVDDTPLPDVATEVFDERNGQFYLADSGVVTTIEANRFVEGDLRFNSVDNLHFQPGTGIVYVIEDHDFGEIFACLRDGGDRDIKTDGCISIASVNDPDAEPTGWEFSGDGVTAYFVVQHGQQPVELLDFVSNPVDGTTDDLIKVTGFRGQ